MSLKKLKDFLVEQIEDYENVLHRDWVTLLVVKEDRACQMVSVWVNSTCVYEGNEWDYHSNCRRSSMAFSGVQAYVDLLVAAIEAEGYEVQVSTEPYVYDE